MKKWFIEIAVLVFISLGLIFYQFPNLPKNLAFDEIDFARLALYLGHHGYIPYVPQATGHATLYFYIMLLSFNLFGFNNFALRFPSALFGFLSVLLFYILMKDLFKKKNKLIPFLLSIILITSHWYLNFARFSFEVTFLLFLELIGTYTLFKFFENKKNAYLILSGLFAGLAFNSYIPGRIFFAVPLLAIVLKKLNKILFFFIPFIIVILPLSIYLIFNTDIRLQQQSYISNSTITFQKKAEFFLTNIQSTAFMFNVKGDMNGRHNYPGKPALNPLIGILFVVGLILALKDFKQFNNQFFIGFFLVALIPTLFTYPWENPNMLRTYSTIPSVIYFMGLSINYFIGFLTKRSFSLRLPIIIIIIFITLSSLYELRTYFVYQKIVSPTSFEIGMKLSDLKPLLEKHLNDNHLFRIIFQIKPNK